MPCFLGHNKIVSCEFLNSFAERGEIHFYYFLCVFEFTHYCTIYCILTIDPYFVIGTEKYIHESMFLLRRRICFSYCFQKQKWIIYSTIYLNFSNFILIYTFYVCLNDTIYAVVNSQLYISSSLNIWKEKLSFIHFKSFTNILNYY